MKKYQIVIAIIVVIILTAAASYSAIHSGKKELKNKKTTTGAAVTTAGTVTTGTAVTMAAIKTFPLLPAKSYMKNSAEIKDGITTSAAIVIKLKKKDEIKIEESKTDTAGKSWSKITVKTSEKTLSGWTLTENVAKEYKDLLKEKYSSLDFSSFPKAENYPNNSRVKVKGVYCTLYSASGSRLEKLIEMTKTTKINAFVIDVKDDNGNMLFKTAAAEKFVPAANRGAPIKDVAAFIKKLKENNIYAIARIVCFKDPNYAKAYPDRVITYKATGAPFVNADKLTWVSAHDRNLWEYNVSVAKEAAAAGFNEIQFDYVRFPASNGGKLDASLNYRNDKNETKPQTIQEYLKYARKELQPLNVYLGADIYGLVGSVEDDMGLGQYWEAVSNVVDYVCPMMYPSHYGNGSYGLSVPDAFPYKTVYVSTRDSVARNKNISTPAIIRPWIQDFTAAWVKGHIRYGDQQVRDQIKALEDNGVDEFLLWNAGNKYTESALK